MKCDGHFMVSCIVICKPAPQKRIVLQPLVAVSRAGLERQEPHHPIAISRHMMPLGLMPGFRTQAPSWWHQEVHHCANAPNITNPVKVYTNSYVQYSLSKWLQWRALLLLGNGHSCVPLEKRMPMHVLNIYSSSVETKKSSFYWRRKWPS